ncbi:hypothetical protein [Streptomyces chartreusis]
MSLIPLPHLTPTPQTGVPSHRVSLSLYQVLDALQDLLRCWSGTCTTCGPLPQQQQTQNQNITKHY